MLDATATQQDTDAQIEGESSQPGEDEGRELFNKLVRWYSRDLAKVTKWRKEAEEDFRFYNGHHWTDDERKALEGMNRPALTFNRSAVLVNAVSGNEISNRREVTYYPREQGDVRPNEVLGAAAEMFRDNCNAEDEESDAFENMLKCGMGWTETRIDHDEDADGEAVIESVDPLEMVWDVDAAKSNLKDATRIFRAKKMSLESAKAMFPDKDEGQLNAAWATNGADSEEVQPIPFKAYDGEGKNAPDNQVVIVEAQWIEYEPFYRVGLPDQATGAIKLQEVNQTAYAEINKANPEIKGVKQVRKKIMKAFLGSELLEQVENLCPTHFSYQAVTGYYDTDTGTWYGIVRATKDPSRWANKWLSQIMHILNSTAKGGIMAERGAFDNDKQAEESWAKSNAITWFKSGAIAAGKVKEKPQAAMPVGFFQLMEYANQSIRDVTGVNLEMMGTREATQSGVLEYQRREAGQIMLAKLFNSLRRYRKVQGKIMLYIIQNYLSDDRLVRIVGDDKKEYVPLTKGQDVKYDIIVDDAPSSPNEKEKTWGLLTQLMPMLQGSLDAEMALELLSYSPLPATIIDKMKAAYQKKQEAAAQDPMAQEKKQLEMQNAQATVHDKQAGANLKDAQTAKTQQEAQTIQMKAQADAMATLIKASQPPANPQVQNQQ